MPATLYGATAIAGGGYHSLALSTADSLSGQGTTFGPTVLTAYNGTVATFNDSNPNRPVTAFSATIDWGDNTAPTAGTVSGSNGQFTVSGTHTYTLPGQYTVTTTVTGPGGPLVLIGTANVGAISTTTELQSGMNPSVYGQSVTFSASVTTQAGGTPVAEGSVDFYDTTTSTDLGSSPVNTFGQASVSTAALSVGGHIIAATYSDSTGGLYTGSDNYLFQSIKQDSTTTTLTLPSTPPDDTQTFTVSATVAPNAPGAGTPSGTVTFTVNGTPQDAPLTNGQASISIGPFATGTVTVSASYGGDGNFNSSSASQQSQTVTPGPATQFVVSAPATATAGTAFNVTVTAEDATGVTVTGYSGTVHFTSTDGAAVLPANATLTAGTGTFSVTLNTGGSQTVTATDTADSSVAGTSGPIQVTASTPVPTLTHLSPPGSSQGEKAFILALTGRGFVAASVVYWNGFPIPTTYVSSTTLTAAVSAALQTAQANVPVTVVNPAPGGTSNALLFGVKAPLMSLTLSKSSVRGGTSLTGTVTVTLPALAGGEHVYLDRSSSLVSLPSTVLIPAGQRSITFTIHTSKVTSKKTVTIKATESVSKYQTLTLTP